MRPAKSRKVSDASELPLAPKRPAPVDVPALVRPFVAADRDFETANEVIRTRCNRVVERTAIVIDLKVAGGRWPGDAPAKTIRSIAHDNTYRLWEPVIEGARYGTTRTNDKGLVWGLAHTRQPSEPLPKTDSPAADHRAAVEWEMKQWAWAVAVIVAACAELGGEGVSDGILTVCGTVRLMGNPKIRAERAIAAARKRKIEAPPA